MTVLVTGGSGCGKSAWAEELMDFLCPGEKLYLATMQAFGEEGKARVEKHRLRRAGHGYITLEAGTDLASVCVPQGFCVLLEDLTNLAANELFSEGGDPSRIVPALEKLAASCRHLVIVTQDVYRDAGDWSPEMKRYFEVLSAAEKRAAELSHLVVEVVYSIPVVLKGEIPCGFGRRC